MRIRSQLVPASIATGVTFAGTSRRVGITIHETANIAAGADAAAHANLQSNGNSRAASWHWTVDETEAVQSFPHTARCWHAGAGTAGDGDDTVAIEICVNADGNYLQAVRNAAELVRHIRATDPSVGGVLEQHHRWSGKDCPTRLRAGSHGIAWRGFLALTTTTTNIEDGFMSELNPDEQRLAFNILRNLDRALVPRDPSPTSTAGKVGDLDEFQRVWRATFNNARDAVAELRDGATSGEPGALSDADVDRIAERVAALLGARLTP
jgi:hypothetical protein